MREENCKLIVIKKEFPTYFGFTRNDIVALCSENNIYSNEERENIKNKLLYELQHLYVERIMNQKSLIHIYDLVGAFLGCSDVSIEE